MYALGSSVWFCCFNDVVTCFTSKMSAVKTTGQTTHASGWLLYADVLLSFDVNVCCSSNIFITKAYVSHCSTPITDKISIAYGAYQHQIYGLCIFTTLTIIRANGWVISCTCSQNELMVFVHYLKTNPFMICVMYSMVSLMLRKLFALKEIIAVTVKSRSHVPQVLKSNVPLIISGWPLVRRE